MDPESEYVVNSLKICSVIISDAENGTKTVTICTLKGNLSRALWLQTVVALIQQV